MRGPHHFWMKSGKTLESASAPNGLVNLLHYDDAAWAAFSAFTTEDKLVKGEIFLVSDGHALSRQEISPPNLCKPASQFGEN